MSLTSNRSTLGILSGHSALAGSCFHARLLNRLREAGAVQDNQYPRIVHWSTPLDGLDDAGLASGQGLASLSCELSRLDPFAPVFVAVTCNSLAHLVDNCRDGGPSAKESFTPVHALNRLAFDGRVLVLSAGNARRFEMVQPRAGVVDYTLGARQQWVADITQAVRAKGVTSELQRELAAFIAAVQAEGYAKVLLACTELSALVPDMRATAHQPYVDAMACLLDMAQARLARPERAPR